MTKIMWIIIGTMIVTYIPRVLPFILISGKPLPRKVIVFLEYVPYAALGALILPGAINAIPDNPLAAACGLAFAGLYSYLKGGMIISVIGGIGVTYLVLLF